MQLLFIWCIFLLFIKLSKTLIEFEFHDKIARFDTFLEPCTNKDPWVIYNVNTRVFKINNNYYYDWQIIVEKDLDYNGGKVKLERCASKEALDTCVKYKELKTNNVCRLLHSKMTSWHSGINACMIRKPTCPMTKGLYTGINCTLDMNTFKLIPFGNYYWKAQFQYIDTKDKPIYCIQFAGQLIRKRG